jgi:hypothetical protein
MLRVGGEGASNVVYDYNSIQARNNGAASPLYLNPQAGAVQVGGTYLLVPSGVITVGNCGGGTTIGDGGFCRNAFPTTGYVYFGNGNHPFGYDGSTFQAYGSLNAQGTLSSTNLSSYNLYLNQDNNSQPVNTQGSYMKWNRYVGGGGDGSGSTYFINQKGGGSPGGFKWGHSDTSNNFTLDMRLDENTTLTSASTLFTGDIQATRGFASTTGAIFLGNNGGTTFLYFDGTNYILQGHNLVVNGVTVSSKRKWKTDINQIDDFDGLALLDQVPHFYSYCYRATSGTPEHTKYLNQPADNCKTDGKRIGFMADDKGMPTAFVGTKRDHIDMSNLATVEAIAIKQLEKRIQVLENMRNVVVHVDYEPSLITRIHKFIFGS